MKGVNKIRDIIVGIITIMSMVVFMLVLVKAIGGSTEAEMTVENLPLVMSSRAEIFSEGEGYPLKLEIPKISVNADFQYVGIGKSGNMAVPTNYKDVGWFRLGAKPGEAGTAVIAGHLDNALGLKGVFGDLTDLKIGDTFQITTKENKKLTFTVKKINEYEYNDVEAAKIVFKNESVPTVRLITCTGDWNQNKKTYSMRHVVTAELTSSI